MVALSIPRGIFDELVLHAQDAAPIEACGILAGHNGNVSKFFKMRNVDESADHFTMDPREQFAVSKQMRAAGLKMLAIHHSHPASPARPSAEDIRLALTPGVIYVILSLQDASRPVLKGFTIEDGVVQESPVQIIEDEVSPMSNQSAQPMLRIPETVRQDVQAYRGQLEKFLRGETSPIMFRGYRVPLGIYEQRTTGRFMVRVRLGAGLIQPHQLKRVAELGKTYGDGVLHLTTRHDIQIHDVAIEDTADVFEKLLEVNLTSRGGGGNTVRNINVCPRSGVCPKEEFDVTPHSIAVAEYLLQHRSSFNLPRKFKLAFSGCSLDCGYASVADLGFFAHIQGGQRGFAVYAAGGLGGSPRTSTQIEEFVPEGEIFHIAEAVKRIFDKHGDRTDKSRARLRYVLERMGAEQFRALYREELAAVKQEGLSGDIPELKVVEPSPAPGGARQNGEECPTAPGYATMAEKTPGFLTLNLRVPLGNISAEDLTQVGEIATRFGQGVVRLNQLQDILIPGVPQSNLGPALEAVKALSVNALVDYRPKIVACAGASTCKLGLCLSRGLATAISESLDETISGATDPNFVIRISGCPNSCGTHQIADIGLEGRAKRHDGRLMPYYEVLVDAKVGEGEAHLGRRIGSVPAKRIPQMLAEAYAGKAMRGNSFEAIVARHAELPTDIPEDYFYDFGADEPFSLAGRGPGECGAGVMDVIRVDIAEARDALKASVAAADLNQKDASIYKALLAAARALLVVYGLELKKDREIFAAFTQRLIEPGWVKAETRKLVDAALDWRLGDRGSIAELAEAVGELVQRVDELFRSLDANLEFRAQPVEKQEPQAPAKEAASHQVDLRGVKCPLNFVKAKVAMEKIPVGDQLEVLLDDGEPVRNVPASFTEQGQEVLEIKQIDGFYSVRLKRNK